MRRPDDPRASNRQPCAGRAPTYAIDRPFGAQANSRTPARSKEAPRRNHEARCRTTQTDVRTRRPSPSGAFAVCMCSRRRGRCAVSAYSRRRRRRALHGLHTRSVPTPRPRDLLDGGPCGSTWRHPVDARRGRARRDGPPTSTRDQRPFGEGAARTRRTGSCTARGICRRRHLSRRCTGRRIGRIDRVRARPVARVEQPRRRRCVRRLRHDPRHDRGGNE